jgi:hypothetical protein
MTVTAPVTIPIKNIQLNPGSMITIYDVTWEQKVYKDGYSAGEEVSIHYFESKSGKVFNLKVKQGWSNQ